ncbi:MAG: hypothetical protein IPG46_12085 [Actinobacteria bacterium]|nr:hypothetical protein [Actinomycetota bacterium]
MPILPTPLTAKAIVNPHSPPTTAPTEAIPVTAPAMARVRGRWPRSIARLKAGVAKPPSSRNPRMAVTTRTSVPSPAAMAVTNTYGKRRNVLPASRAAVNTPIVVAVVGRSDKCANLAVVFCTPLLVLP